MRPQCCGVPGKWAWMALMVFAEAAAFLQGCGPSANQSVSVGLPRPVTGRPECPGEGVRLTVDTGNLARTVIHVPLSDSITNIPEFHDCQRFLVRGAGRRLVFDSLYAVFASFKLDRLLQDLNASTDTITLNTGVHVMGVPVATIYSDHRQYQPLGIQPGFNCLLLYRQLSIDSPNESTWGAKMIPLPPPDSNCVNVEGNLAGTPLQVDASSVPGLAESDYPPAARWDWDPADSEQYIGVKCGAAWCQVGKFGFDTSASYSGPPLKFKPIGGGTVTKAESLRVTAIRGWYDEQLLDESEGGLSVPSGQQGFLIPNPDLDKLKAEPDPYLSQWVQVGFAVIQGGYYKWNYHHHVNQILLCHGSADNCQVSGIVQNQPAESPSTTRPKDCTTGWLAAVGPATAGPLPSGKFKLFCLRETNHQHALDDLNSRYPNVISSIPATARWRWLLKDAGSWFGCYTASCCTKT